MKNLSLIYLLCGVYFCYVSRLTTEGQHFEDIDRSFQNFTLDEQHRGTFNVNLCLKELFNCWEYMPMEMTCEWDEDYKAGIRFDSYCTVMYKDCWDKDNAMYSSLNDRPFQVSLSDCEDETQDRTK